MIGHKQLGTLDNYIDKMKFDDTHHSHMNWTLTEESGTTYI